MVSDIYEPTEKGKATSTAELEIKIQSKKAKRLKHTIKDFTSLKTLPKRLPRNMATSNPVVPVMDWTEDAELHKRYVEWKEEVELELGSSLSNRANSDGQVSQLETIIRVFQILSSKHKGASVDAILEALVKKTKPKSNEIAAFTKLCSLKQGDISLPEFIKEARRLAELCNYPNNQDRLIRDTIVSGVYGLRAYQKCIDAKDLSLQERINIYQAEDAIRMQVQECRPESVDSIQSAQTMILVHRLHHGFKQSSNGNRHKNKSSQNCYYCDAPNWTREHSKVCRAKNSICGKCDKKGHLNSLCKSTETPLHMLEAQDCSHPQSQETAQDCNQSAETVQYSTPTSYPERSCHSQGIQGQIKHST